MCEPTTIIMLATAAAGALAQKSASDRAAVQQAEGVNRNLRETYAANQEQARQADQQAFVQQTDRARQAAQQLAMARVIAAEGSGSLAARAININAGASEDFSRIDASLRNTHSSLQSANAAGQAGAAAKMDDINANLAANQTRFFTQVGTAAASAAATSYTHSVQRDLAYNYVDEAMQRRRAFPWATGTSGIGD